MNKIEKAFIDYRLQGGLLEDFDTWYDQLLFTARNKSLEEELVYLNQDEILAEGYYDALCEAIEVTLKTKDKEKRDQTKEAISRYEKYKAKRKAKGQEVLDFREWIEEQDRARALKHEAAKAGIKIIGTVGSTAALSKCVKNRTVEIKTKNNYIKVGEQKAVTPNKRKKKK